MKKNMVLALGLGVLAIGLVTSVKASKKESYDKIKQVLADAKTEFQYLKTSIETTERERTEAQKTIAKFENTEAQLKGQITQAEQNLETTRTQLTEARKKLDQLNWGLERDKKDILNAQKRIATFGLAVRVFESAAFSR